LTNVKITVRRTETSAERDDVSPLSVLLDDANFPLRKAWPSILINSSFDDRLSLDAEKVHFYKLL
jgi:hypothetical protein